MNALLDHRFPLLREAVRRRIAELSDGNARVALLIAEGARHDAADANLGDLGDEDLFRRLFRQRDETNEELLRTAEVLSLVYSFDGETTQGTDAELPLLCILYRGPGSLPRNRPGIHEECAELILTA